MKQTTVAKSDSILEIYNSGKNGDYLLVDEVKVISELLDEQKIDYLVYNEEPDYNMPPEQYLYESSLLIHVLPSVSLGETFMFLNLQQEGLVLKSDLRRRSRMDPCSNYSYVYFSHNYTKMHSCYML